MNDNSRISDAEKAKLILKASSVSVYNKNGKREKSKDSRRKSVQA